MLFELTLYALPYYYHHCRQTTLGNIHTSIVVLVYCLKPSNVIMSVRHHVDVDRVVNVQHSSWADLSPLGRLSGDSVSYDRKEEAVDCLLYTSPSPRDATLSRMPSSA